ncbi:MAG: serine/threonine-protein phosphatase [Bacteroidetes bacterium]|nr:serine/threonine-protein phosphatase [Bacteroidota bacterium]
MKLRVASISDRGLNPNRTHNEDSYLVADPLFIVADGLGGELAGEVASNMTIEKFKDFFEDATRENGLSAPSELKTLEKSVKRVNAVVHSEAQKPEYHNMGSTLSILYFFQQHSLVGHVGDSKIYRVRNDEFEQLTKDQSIVQQMIDRGIISPEQARRHPMRNVLLSCIAHKPDVDVYLKDSDVQINDFYMLCSDGVSEYVNSDDIRAFARGGKSPEEICQEIKDMVYEGGAMDNLTAIIILVDSLD